MRHNEDSKFLVLESGVHLRCSVDQVAIFPVQGSTLLYPFEGNASSFLDIRKLAGSMGYAKDEPYSRISFEIWFLQCGPDMMPANVRR